MFEAQLKKLGDLKPILNAVGKEEYWGYARFLFERLRNPDSYVVFIGETSSGKSSIINGILGSHILPVSAAPTTAAITEIVGDSKNQNYAYEVLYKNGSKRSLESSKIFHQLALRPEKDISRLRVLAPSNQVLPQGIRIFDTPGYNSIVSEHEEVLKDFLPNSDVVIYTIGYKIGIQNEDFTFMRYLRELIRSDVPIILVVNRCPETVTLSNPRIKEIKKYASDILGLTPQIHLVLQTVPSNPNLPALPKANSVINAIRKELDSKERLSNLENAFDGFINELYDKCNSELQKRLATSQLSFDSYAILKREQEEASKNLLKAIPDLIEPAFDRLERRIPELTEKVAERVSISVIDRLDKVSKLDKEEEIAYVNNFFLPEKIRINARDIIQDYIEVELNDLNNKVDDYIQKEIIEFNSKVTIQVETNVNRAYGQLIKKYLGEASTNTLGRYFLQFGGQGGAGAGIANAASHTLKKIGDLFGKRFSRETHNALKHYLAKFGATSMKAVGLAVTVIFELAFEIWDISTWKSKTRKAVQKSLNEWKNDTLPSVLKDLKKLKAENIETVKKIAEETGHSFEDVKPKDYDRCLQDVELAQTWAAKYR